MKTKQPKAADYLFVQKYICENINKTQPKTTNSIFTINAIQAIECAIRAAFECNIGSVPAYISDALKFAHKFIGENPKKEFEGICIVNDAVEEYFASLDDSNKVESPKFIDIPYFIDHLDLVGGFQRGMHYTVSGGIPSGKTSRLLENLALMRESLKDMNIEIFPNLKLSSKNRNHKEEIDKLVKEFQENSTNRPRKPLPNFRWINPDNPDQQIEVFAYSFLDAHAIVVDILKGIKIMYRDVHSIPNRTVPNWRWTNPKNQDENVEVFARNAAEALEKIQEIIEETNVVFVSDQDIKPIINE